MPDVLSIAANQFEALVASKVEVDGSTRFPAVLIMSGVRGSRPPTVTGSGVAHDDHGADLRERLAPTSVNLQLHRWIG